MVEVAVAFAVLVVLDTVVTYAVAVVWVVCVAVAVT
jgi:hypothetical protein